MLDALGIFYPQYWLASNVESSFCTPLDILKNHYCEMKHLGITWNMLDKWEFDVQHDLFKWSL
jgi:hypothetical protein